MRPLAFVLCACLLTAGLPAAAQVYRWADDSGRLTYGNNPPPGAARLTRLDGARPPPGFRQKQRRDFPGAATPAPSEFPGHVDRRTVAAAFRALEGRDCERRSPRCGSAAVTRAPPDGSLPPLSALQLP
jgi:hypothetical protein